MPFSKISHTRKVHPYIPGHVVMRWDGNDKWIDESEVYLQVQLQVKSVVLCDSAVRRNWITSFIPFRFNYK